MHIVGSRRPHQLGSKLCQLKDRCGRVECTAAAVRRQTAVSGFAYNFLPELSAVQLGTPAWCSSPSASRRLCRDSWLHGAARKAAHQFRVWLTFWRGIEAVCYISVAHQSQAKCDGRGTHAPGRCICRCSSRNPRGSGCRSHRCRSAAWDGKVMRAYDDDGMLLRCDRFNARHRTEARLR